MTKQVKFSEGEQELILKLKQLKSTVLQFPEKLTASEWTEKHARLPKETSADPGQVQLYGYQRGLLDAMSDPTISQVTVLKAARVGYTALLGFAVGYYLEHESASVLIAQPTDDDAKDWSKTSFTPMMRDTPSIKELKRPGRKGEPTDTWSDWQFKNGAVLKIRGAASDDAFRRITTRVNIGDEIDADAWRDDVKGSQGDKIRLMKTRGDTFWNSKTIVGSTPLNTQSSRIYREYLKSDQRKYFVPCPHCNEKQVLKWGGAEVPYGIKWDSNEDRDITKAYYVCEHNGCIIEEKDKFFMDANGEWIATAKPKIKGHAGFHIWTGQSLFAKASWVNLVQEWLEASKKPELLQPFVNLRLGEPFEYRKELKPEIDIEETANNLEIYGAEVPNDALVLTAGVDVQTGSEKAGKPARVEVSVWAWGRAEESWLIKHEIIEGAMDSPDTQDKLDAFLSKPFENANGRKLYIQATSVDMGGHYTQAVRDFARKRIKRNIWAIKGRNIRLGSRSQGVWPRAASRKKSDQWFMIDTQLAKDIIGRRFKIKQDGPGRIHFPVGTEEEYLSGLASESLVTDDRGNTYWKKINPKAYGEPLDCYVYAYAALCGLKMTSKVWSRLDDITPENITDKKSNNISDKKIQDDIHSENITVKAKVRTKARPVSKRSGFMSRSL